MIPHHEEVVDVRIGHETTWKFPTLAQEIGMLSSVCSYQLKLSEPFRYVLIPVNLFQRSIGLSAPLQFGEDNSGRCFISQEHIDFRCFVRQFD